MTVYTTIPDTDINPDKPIKSETGYALRDNPLAIAEGDPTAPSINPAALLIGGKGGDGIFDNATPAITDSGYYEFTSMNVTTAKSMPLCSMLRLAGNGALSSTLTIANRSPNVVTTLTELSLLQDFFSVLAGNAGADGSPAHGGGSAGSGGGASAGVGKSPSSFYNWWLQRKFILGGNGGRHTSFFVFGQGGGSFILITEGDLDLTGAIIDANGTTGDGSGNGGGGGGGSIIVICTGTITGGTFNANGATANNSRGGGGGFVKLVASNYIGTQTMNVNGNSGGANGYSNKQTLTRDQIRTMLQRA